MNAARCTDPATSRPADRRVRLGPSTNRPDRLRGPHGVSAAGANDAWTDQFLRGGHGDATMVHGGTPGRIGGTHAIPIESLRMRFVRDGRGDHEPVRTAEQHERGARQPPSPGGLFPATYDTTRTDAQVLSAPRSLIDLETS